MIEKLKWNEDAVGCPLERRVMPLPLGTKTQWGKIEMVGITGGERYYWMLDKHGGVSMIPASIVEQGHNRKGKGLCAR